MQRRLLPILASVTVLAVPIAAAAAVGEGGQGAHSAAGKALPRNSVGPRQLKARAVTRAKLARGAVGATQLANGAVGAADLAPGAVGRAALQSGSVGPAQLAAGAVGATALGVGAVGTAQIAAGAVDGSRIKSGSVGGAQLAPGVVPPATSGTGTGVAGPVAIGTSATQVAQLTSVAAGSYLVIAKLWVDSPTTDPVVTCTLDAGGAPIDEVHVATDPEQVSVALQALAALDGTVELSCSGDTGGTSARDAKLSVVRLGAINTQ